MRATGLQHTTTSTGTGTLTLSAVTGWPTYADAFGTSGVRLVEYQILDPTTQAVVESGVGEIDLSTMVLTRTLVQMTWDGTTYSTASPSPLNLSAGTRKVICGPSPHSLGSIAMLASPGENAGVGPALPVASAAAATITHQEIMVCWFPLLTARAVTQLLVRVGNGYTGGTSSLNGGIYQIASNGKPGRRMVDFGNLGSLTANTTLANTALSPAVFLPPSPDYALLLLPQFSGGTGTPQLLFITSTHAGCPFGLAFAGTPSNRAVMRLSVTGQTSLPADASGLTYSIANANTMPLAGVK